MLYRARLLLSFDLQDIVGHEITTAMRVRKAAARIVAVPFLRLEGQQVVAKIKMDGNAFTGSPFHIWIEKIVRGGRGLGR